VFLSSRSRSIFLVLLILILFPALLALAQGPVTGDSRGTVPQPSFPPVCTVLKAAQVAGSLNESVPDTARVQAAITACPVGQAVDFSASGGNNAFLIAPITLKAGVTLLVDAEVIVFGSINHADYGCTSTWCHPLIDVAPNADPGPGSAVMGYGIIDGRGGVAGSDSHETWWANSGSPRPRLIFLGDPANVIYADDFTLYKITLQNSPMYHLTGFGNELTVWDVKITAPSGSPNTDGVDPLGSSNLTITNSFISDGDDMISMKSGTVDDNLSLGTFPVSNVTISNMHTYAGHGISIGSEATGVNNILVNTVAMDNGFGGSSANSLRVKAAADRGGEVKNLLYENICINNGGDTLVFNPYYDNTPGTLYPNFHDITIRNLHQLIWGKKNSTLEGYDLSGVAYPLGLTLDNVIFDNYATGGLTGSNVNNAAFTLGPGPVTIANDLESLAGTAANNITITNDIGNSSPPLDCSKAFVYLAGELFAGTSTPAAGQPLALTAIVQPIASYSSSYPLSGAPTGTITIFDGSTPVASGPVTAPSVSYTNASMRTLTQIAVPSVTVGTHTYTAEYSGDTNFAPLSFGSFTVTAAGQSMPTTTTVTHLPASVVYGASVTYTAMVAPNGGSGTPTGTVTYTVDGTQETPVTLVNGAGTWSIALPIAGAHSVSAAYSGDGTFAASSGSDASFSVSPAAPTISVTCPAAIPYDGNAHSCTATATGVGGATVNGSFAWSPVASETTVGTYPLTATFTSSDPNYSNGTPAGGSLVITQSTPAVTVTCPAGVVYDGNGHSCTVVAKNAAGSIVAGMVTIVYNGSLAAPSDAGTYPVTAAFNPTDTIDYFSGASSTGSLVIGKATPTVTVTCPTGIIYDGNPHGCTPDITGVGGGPVIGSIAISNNGSSSVPVAAGTYTVIATFTSGDPNYGTGSGTSLLTIGAVVPAISTWSPAEQPANAAAFTLTVTGSNFLPGAIVNWNGTPQTTTVVNSTQLTAAIPSADLGTVGTASVTVTNPLAAGSASAVPFKFAIDTAAGTSGAAAVAATSSSITVTPGQSTTASVSFTGATANAQITANCVNLPTGITCGAYNSSNNSVPITTAANLAPGQYQITIIFTIVQQPATTAAAARCRVFFAAWSGLLSLPMGLLWIGGSRRKALRRILLPLVGLMLLAALVGCGGSSTASAAPAATVTSQSSVAVLLNVQ
jgi:hypothetical protein